MDKKSKYQFFAADGHLNDEAVALAAECMLVPGSKSPDQEVQEHLLSCETCHERVISLYQDLKEESSMVADPDRQVHRGKISWSGKRVLRILAAAAVLMVLLGVGAVLFFNRDHDPEALFNTYFEPYADIITTKSNNNKLMQQAMLHYSLGDYDSAAVLLSHVTRADPSNIPASFYLANAWLSLDRAEDALPLLAKIAGSGHALSRPARWYLALTYIRLEMPEQAIPHLKALSSQESYYENKARKILRKIG